MSGLPEAMKKQVLGMIQQAQQPSPMQQQAAQVELAGKAAQVDKVSADASKARAQAVKTMHEVGKTQADTRKAHAEATDKQMDTALKFMMPQPMQTGSVDAALMGAGAPQASPPPF